MRVPPYTITNTMLGLVADIGEVLGRLSVQFESEQALRLRKVNRMRTIQGSLAIEGSTLTEVQITAMLEGKKVVAPPREVQEARNAIVAYDKLSDWTPSSQGDLLAAHEELTKGLVERAGVYRSGGVGVMSGDKVVHMAPQADRVPHLMKNLLGWLATTEVHPLISSCVFHYELEFIHPFEDGNGRIGRLWQTLILSKWHALFADIPVESLVFQHQEAYYAAIRASTVKTDSAPFVEFMLNMILEAINDGVSDGASGGVKLDKLDKALLRLFKQSPQITQDQLSAKLGKSLRTIERRVKKLKGQGKLIRRGSDKTGHWEVL